MMQFVFIFAQSILYVLMSVGIWIRSDVMIDTFFPLSWYNMSFIALSPPIILMVMR